MGIRISPEGEVYFSKDGETKRKDGCDANEIMELMAPDVIVVPQVYLTTNDCPERVYRDMRLVAEEYARRMDWGFQ